MELMVCIVKDHRHVEEILTGFLELGIRGATVADVKGMGQIISKDIPIFTGFESLFPGGGTHTFMILSVITRDDLKRAARLVDEVCGNLKKPGTGFLFTLPVRYVKGMAEEID
jgi:nitrogen regulatory protein PII